MRMAFRSGAVATAPPASGASSVGFPADDTVPGARIFYAIIREILAVIEDEGITPDGADLTQLLQAINAKITAAVDDVDIPPAVTLADVSEHTQANPPSDEAATPAGLRAMLNALFGSANRREFTTAGSHSYNWEWDTPNGLAVLVGGTGGGGGGGGGGGAIRSVSGMQSANRGGGGRGGNGGTPASSGAPGQRNNNAETPFYNAVAGEGGDGGNGGETTRITVGGVSYQTQGGYGGGGGGGGGFGGGDSDTNPSSNRGPVGPVGENGTGPGVAMGGTGGFHSGGSGFDSARGGNGTLGNNGTVGTFRAVALTGLSVGDTIAIEVGNGGGGGDGGDGATGGVLSVSGGGSDGSNGTPGSPGRVMLIPLF